MTRSLTLGAVYDDHAPLLDEFSVRVLSCKAGLAVVDEYVAELFAKLPPLIATTAEEAEAARQKRNRAEIQQHCHLWDIRTISAQGLTTLTGHFNYVLCYSIKYKCGQKFINLSHPAHNIRFLLSLEVNLRHENQFC